MPQYTVAELAALVSGAVEGDAGRRVQAVAPADRAGPADLAFATSRRYLRLLGQACPGAVVLPPELDAPSGDVPVIRVADPALAISRILEAFHPEPDSRPVSVSPTARLGHGVELGSRVSVEAGAVLGEGVSIGSRTRIGAQCWIDDGVRIGTDCRLDHACSVLRGSLLGDRVRLHSGARIGTEGFGYALGSEGRVKVPQVGGCRIGDDVEIGANSTVDRGTLSDTVIGARTKIDNLVHVGHNVCIGEDCVIVAQVGVAGSVEIGRGVVLAGQAGIADHVRIGDGAQVAAQAGVIGDVPAGATYSDYPARPHAEAMRARAALSRLPDLLRRLRRLERGAATPSEKTEFAADRPRGPVR